MTKQSIQYVPAAVVRAPELALQEGKRLPRDWAAVPVGGADTPLRLAWTEEAVRAAGRPSGAEGRLRITAALVFREARSVEAFLPESGTVLGRFDVRYAYPYQPFELALSAGQTEAVLREGIGLRLEEGWEIPLWIFDGLGVGVDNGSAPVPRLFAPHLLFGAAEQPMRQFLDSVASLSSLQPFGWLEGCVLDGLYDLRAVLGAQRMESVLEAHLARFIDPQGRLIYEDPHGRPADGTFTTIEATLPLGVIVKHRPDHPVVQSALAFWDARGAGGGGAVIDGDTVSAEGAYTVAYPLAAVAARLGRRELAEQAVRQSLLRRDSLAAGPHVFLRYHRDSGTYTFRSWARAFAWYMLGMTRTWIELKQSDFAGLPGVGEMEEELRRVAEAALSWRGPESLWSVFLDEPAVGIDTSGSAGIAAALALGARHGLLPPRCRDAAEESLAALVPYLTPDGILGGVAQHNAGGIALQRGGYRVLSQMGMGMMAQLYAALRADG